MSFWRANKASFEWVTLMVVADNVYMTKSLQMFYENHVFGFEWDPYQNLTVTTQILQDEMYDLYDIPSRHYDTTFPTEV